MRLFILMMMLGCGSQLFSQTILLNGSSVSGTWTVAEAPYVIEGSVQVPAGDTLIIEAGVEVRLKSTNSTVPGMFNFNSTSAGIMYVRGSIIANGTPDAPILFTRSGSSGFWGAIVLGENSQAVRHFEHCVVEYARQARLLPDIAAYQTLSGALSAFKTDVQIQDCVFRNNAAAGVGLWEVHQATVEHCTFESQGTNGLFAFRSRADVLNNRFTGNSVSAVEDAAALFASESHTRLANNLFFDNVEAALHIQDSSAIVLNNTISGNFDGIRIVNAPQVDLINTIIYNNSSANFSLVNATDATLNVRHCLTNNTNLPDIATNLGGNFTSSNPFFIGAATDDYHLAPNSGCINGGTSAFEGWELPATDLDGGYRVAGAAVDIGVYEVPNTYGTLDTATCGAFTGPSGNYIFANTGIYTDTIPNFAGGDSIITINLTNNAPYAFISIVANTWTMFTTETDLSFQWVNCTDGYAPIEGATTPTYTVTDNDAYAVFISNEFCVDTVGCLTFNILDAPETHLASLLRVSPNPADSYLNLQFPNLNGSIRYELFGSLGTLILTGELSRGGEVSGFERLPAGVYWLRCHFEGDSVVHKIIKQS